MHTHTHTDTHTKKYVIYKRGLKNGNGKGESMIFSISPPPHLFNGIAHRQV